MWPLSLMVTAMPELDKGLEYPRHRSRHYCKEWSALWAQIWGGDLAWRRLLRFLRIPWTARKSNQSILKEISPKYSLWGLMLKLKLQYFGYLMPRADSLEKTLMLGKIEGRRRRGDRGWDGWVASLTQWTWVWASSRSWWWTAKPGVLQSMGSQRTGHNWTELFLPKWSKQPRA